MIFQKPGEVTKLYFKAKFIQIEEIQIIFFEKLKISARLKKCFGTKPLSD